MNRFFNPHSPSANSPHKVFLALVPQIEAHARFRFRGITCQTKREDQIAEAVALAWQWFLSLRQRGKDAAQFPAAFSSLVARAVCSGRRLCGMEKAQEVLSPIARHRGIVVERLPTSTRSAFDALIGRPLGQKLQDALEERLRDNTLTPVPEQVAFRCDWPEFVATLSDRDCQLVAFLALGHRAQDAAARFGVTPARVSQLRKQWCRNWRRFQGDHT